MMKIDLKSMSRKELEKLRVDVDKALEKLKNKDKRAAKKAAEEAASKFGFSLAELSAGTKTAPVRKTRKTTPSKPRYVNPDDAGQTWTGKGRQPNWFKLQIEKGVSPDALEIK